MNPNTAIRRYTPLSGLSDLLFWATLFAVVWAVLALFFGAIGYFAEGDTVIEGVIIATGLVGAVAGMVIIGIGVAPAVDRGIERLLAWFDAVERRFDEMESD